MRLKKISFIAALIVLFQSVAMAEIGEGKISIGLEIAPAISWLGFGDNDQVEGDGCRAKLGGGVNVFFNYGPDFKYSVHTGLKVNSFGGWAKGELPTISERARYTFQEIEIPVGVRLRTGNFDKWRLFANLGVGLGIIVRGVATMKAQNGLDGYELKNYSYKPFPLRALYNIGIGAEYDLEAVVLTTTLRYKGSISPIYFYNDGLFGSPASVVDLRYDNKDNISGYDKVKFRPHLIELGLGVIF